MAIVTKITQPGNRQLSTLDGKITIDQSDNIIISTDSSGNVIKTDDGNTELRYREDGSAYYISGVVPTGDNGDVYAREGVDVRDTFN